MKILIVFYIEIITFQIYTHLRKTNEILHKLRKIVERKQRNKSTINLNQEKPKFEHKQL